MGIIGNIILGVLFIAGGVLLLKYNYQVANGMPLSLAERYLGTSYTAWKVVAILVIAAGFTIMFGIYDHILSWLLSPLTNTFSS